MVAKHVRSAILSSLLLGSTESGESGSQVREVLDILFPTFIRSYLLDEENQFRQTPTSTAPLQSLISTMRQGLADRLVTLFAQHWPEEAAELTNRTAIEQIIDSTATELDTVVKRLHRRLTWAKITRSELHRKKDSGLIDREEEQLLQAMRRFHQLHRHLRPADLHADSAGGGGIPAGLWRL